MVIKPTQGRVLWYMPGRHEGFTVLSDQPCAATVAYVHNDRLVNLTVHDHLGVVHSLRSVQLAQPEDIEPGANIPAGQCGWMPYQKGQAAALEAHIAKDPAGG